uniref:Uncharacterized protein n=1 Tax=Siphoviridae sp. ctfbh2 TaxID=2827909 RepID=A0A8S5T3X6_9CAUD|nr:MAG TPA: hypothetical protein [Siphoviridae sp. ctfbh2]
MVFGCTPWSLLCNLKSFTQHSETPLTEFDSLFWILKW